METKVLDGKKVAAQIRIKLKRKLQTLRLKPTLAVVLVGEDPASEIYVGRKKAVALEIGSDFRLLQWPLTVKQPELEKIVSNLNKDPKVRGVIVQQPLPRHIDADEIDCLVSPKKDVDGLNPLSPFIPATTRGIFELLAAYKVKIEGKKVVVVGRSKLVGLPTALEFLNRGATVTICHSKTRDLAAETKQADILVVAAGKPKLIKKNMVKTGAVVIDVGINRDSETHKLVGDVDFENVRKVASKITPVPGGVGPMTVAGLLSNLVEAAFTQD